MKIILKTLEDLGYDVFYDVLVASDFGVPQARNRIYIVCFRKDLGVTNFNFPKPTYKKIYVKDILEDDEKAKDCIVNRTDLKFWKKDETPSLKLIQIGQINNGGQGERIYSINGHAITLSAYGSGMRKSIAADAMIIFTMAVGTVLEIHGAFPLKNPTQIEKHALIAIIRRFNYVYYRER